MKVHPIDKKKIREAVCDKQIEADLEAGKLDKLLDEADRDFEQGRCGRPPGVTRRLARRSSARLRAR
jgi:hypothetical protein